MTTKTIHVAVGVVQNTQGQILLSKRADHLHQGGLWEFPGGKVELGERVFDALVREFQEEVDITITHAEPFMKIQHDYGDKHVLLDVWLASAFNGKASSNENQLIDWVEIEHLNDYDFPDANQAIIERLMAK